MLTWTLENFLHVHLHFSKLRTEYWRMKTNIRSLIKEVLVKKIIILAFVRTIDGHCRPRERETRKVNGINVKHDRRSKSKQEWPNDIAFDVTERNGKDKTKKWRKDMSSQERKWRNEATIGQEKLHASRTTRGVCRLSNGHTLSPSFLVCYDMTTRDREQESIIMAQHVCPYIT